MAQRDDLVMVIAAADTDMAAVAKLVDGVDQELGYVWCWTYAMPFEADATAYADRVAAEIATVHAVVDAKLRAGGGIGWPTLPASLHDRSRPAAQRLRSAVAILRALAPKQPGSVTIFGLLPSRIDDGAGWGALCAAIVDHDFPLPWCAGVRFLLRDDRSKPALAMITGPRIRRMPIDFGPTALSAALKAERDDPSVPDGRRAQAALIAAGTDQAHGRLDDATQGYRAVLDHAGPAGNAILAATAACGLAACREQGGDVDGAELLLLAAVEACLQTQPTPFSVLLNVFQSLVMLVARQKRWLEAEAHLTAVAWLTDILVMPHSRAEALDRRGMAQLNQGRVGPAEASWRLAATAAKEAEEPDMRRVIHGRLADLLRRSGRPDEAAALLAERAV